MGRNGGENKSRQDKEVPAGKKEVQVTELQERKIKVVQNPAKKVSRKDWVTIATTGQLLGDIGRTLSTTAMARMDILQLSQAWKFTTS